MNTKQKMIVSALIFLCAVVSGTAYAQCQVQVMGKYHIEILQQQWDMCQSGACSECLYDNYPDNFADHDNPFDTDDGGNCNGMKSISLGLFKYKEYTLSLSKNNPLYMNFLICGTATMLNELVTTCSQRKGEDDFCYYNQDGDWIGVPGAYLVGSEIHLDQDIHYHFDFGELGHPPQIHEGDWDNLRLHIEDAISQGAYGWFAVYMGAITYMNDSHDYGTITAKPAGDKFVDSYDYEWGEKVMAHALHCWQCWEGGQYQYDLWSQVGIECIPFIVSETPSFIFSIAAEYNDLIYLPVNSESMTWGGLKVLYR